MTKVAGRVIAVALFLAFIALLRWVFDSAGFINP